MDKRLAGLLGAMGVLAVAAPALATTNDAAAHGALTAGSYADLLTPIPNATTLLRTADVVAVNDVATATVVEVEYHPRHRTYYRRRYYPHRRVYHHHSMVVSPNSPKPV